MRRVAPPYSRPHLIERLRRRLDRDGYPRAQMLLIVLLTSAAGFVASWLLLHVGVRAMALRYALACLLAYVVFLALLWLWMRMRKDDYLDVPDFSHPNAPPANVHGDGGESAGGGASAHWDAVDGDDSVVLESVETPTDSGIGDALGAAADTDEFAIPLFLVIALAAMVLSSLLVIWSAPVLFAELLVDGVLAASLYRRLRGIETRYWLDSAVRRTVWPFLATTLIAAATGWALQTQAPGALTLGDALARLAG